MARIPSYLLCGEIQIRNPSHLAKALVQKVVGTGRSDFPNQVNNVLVFPGIFKGALVTLHITSEMKLCSCDCWSGSQKN